MSESKNIYTSIVTLFRNPEFPDDYYIRYDSSPEKAEQMLVRLKKQYEYNVELALQIPFTFEPSESFYNPAKQEAELFVDFLKEEISSAYKEESFLGGWYEIKKLDKEKWLKDFKDWKDRREQEMMVRDSPSQHSLDF